MSTHIEHEVIFERGGAVRLAVTVETAAYRYTFNVWYPDEGTALARFDQDTAAIVAADALRAELQQELERGIYWQTFTLPGGARLLPYERRARLRPPMLLGDPLTHVTAPEVRLVLLDEVLPAITEGVSAAELDRIMPRADRLFSLCRGGCIYKEATPADVRFYLDRHRAAARAHAQRLAARVELLALHTRQRGPLDAPHAGAPGGQK